MKPTKDWREELNALATRRHQSQVADLEKKIKALRAHYEEAEKRLGVALELRKYDRSLKPIVPRQTKASESTAIAIASDWHVEENVDPSTVNGLNDFNLEIADRRIRCFFQNIVRLAEIQRVGTDIDTLVLALIGDFMSGYIHEELIESNEMSPTQTVLWLIPRFVAGFDLLKKHFKTIKAPCNIGNHGRTTLKRRVATHYKNSYEWLMYHVLAMNITGVEFSVPNGYHNLFDVYGYRIRSHHGDAIRYQGGVGGITIPANKAISQWNRGGAAYLDLFGHWHQRLDGGHFLSNASLIGHNPFAIEIKAAPEPPTQTFCLIEKKHGKTITTPIWLDE